MRSVAEWQGKTDDAYPPGGVRLRIWARYHGICQCGCGLKITAADQWDVDHQIALINGGKNAESNLVPLLREHHREKTRTDMATKAKTARVQAKHLGIKKAKRSFPTNKDQPYKAKIGGGVERRRSLDRQGHVAVKRRAGTPAPSPASPWRSLKLETERLVIDRMLWPIKDHLVALNDQQHMRFSEQRRLVHTHATQEQVIAASIASEYTQHPRLLFYVWIRQLSPNSHPLLGLAGSLSVDLDIANKRADMGVMLLPRWQRKGIALEAWKGMLQHLVEKEGVKKIEAGFPATHTAMQNICINSGMVYEGRRENHFDLGNGAREAVVYYGASL